MAAAGPGLKCDVAADPPPATLVLSGELEHQSECLGVYALAAPRAHGRAHATCAVHEAGLREESLVILEPCPGNSALQSGSRFGNPH
jgi:hypothetical protein